ncbi:hypothetical protein CAL7716_036890 [Calothrix sp. PCC 7716]|nr:hypothetical protein CAL7716_036890 [Calothrix sp. PCC 7716]
MSNQTEINTSANFLDPNQFQQTLTGSRNNDYLYGNNKNDYINGGLGSDYLWGRSGNDLLIGGAGDDYLVGGVNNDILKGSSGNDVLWGDKGNDRLEGGIGKDTLFGGSGNDIAIDADGGDRITGGRGNDEFSIGNGQLGSTVITDFKIGIDQVKFQELGITYDKLSIKDIQQGTAISFQGREIVTLLGIKTKDIKPDQFIFGKAELAGELKSAIDQVINTTGVPGASVAVTTTDGSTWLGVGGLSNIAEVTPMQTDDRFYIGSVTKPMVSTVVLQLLQEGTLNLEDTVSKWLPDLARLIPNSDRITVRQLLNHTSGVKDYLAAGLTQDLLNNPALGFQPWTVEEILTTYVAGKPADFNPGEQFNYSNTGYRLLGEIIETATNTTLSQQLQERIFKPLGMTNTFYDRSERIKGDITHGYVDFNNDGKIDFTNDLDTRNANLLDIAGSAGAVISTSADVSRFIQGLTGGELLTPQAFQQMRNDNYPEIPYGRGLLSTTLSDGTEVVGHSGGTPGWNTWMLSYPQVGATAVVLTNGVLEVNPNVLLTKKVVETLSQRYPFDNDPRGNA